jgi:F-type H+-transporting ATPase subunit delta
MNISKQARREAKHLFRACVVNGVLDEGRAREAVRKVIAAKPRGYLGILLHFQRLVKLDLDRHTAKIESAVPLSSQLQDSVRANLTKLYGQGLSISFVQNPALIGGLRIKVGSDVYDGSVQAKLRDLQGAF